MSMQEHGKTAMHVAASVGDVDTIGALANEGGDANARDDQGRSPLFYAEQNGKTAAADFLKQLEWSGILKGAEFPNILKDLLKDQL